MKKQCRMLLALSVAILMLATVIPVGLVAYAEPEYLVDLDFSTYVKDTTSNPDTVTGNIGSVTNSGSLAASTKVVMSSYERYNGNEMKKGTFKNMSGESVPFVNYTQSEKTCSDRNRFRYIETNAIEDGDNTIVFWAKYQPVAGQNITSIFQYYTEYTDEAAATELLELNSGSVATDAETPGFRLVDNGDQTSTLSTGITEMAAGKWAQFVIVNPEYEYLSGEEYGKTFYVYVNGVEVGTKTVAQPAGSPETVRLAFGGAYYAADPNPWSQGLRAYWPKEINFGEIQVIDGALETDEIQALYEATKDKYDENTAIAPTYDESTPTPPPAPGPGDDDPVADPYTGNALIDLDMSTYVEDTETNPDSVTTSIGSIVNSGTLASSTVVKMSANNPNGNWRQLTLKKESLRNVNGEDVYYIHRTIAPINCFDKNRHNIVIENGMEEQANTISFWAKHVPVNKAGQEYNILDYNVSYSDEADPTHLMTLDQAPTTSDGFKLVGHGQSPIYGDIKDQAADKWALYTVTNPKYDVNGTKTMKVYVNGTYLGSNTVTKPAGDLEEAKLCFGGESEQMRAGYNWPTDISLGDIAVYEGEMTGSEIASLYAATKDKYAVDESFITDEDAGPTKSPILVEFDLDNFSYSTEGSSGITNKGTSDTAQFDIHSVNADNYNISINKQTLYNTDLEKAGDYILLTHDRGEQNEMGKQGMVHHFKVTDEAFEDNSITVSFWVNIDKGTRQLKGSQYVELAQYEIKYTYDGEADGEPATLTNYLRNRLWQWNYDAEGAPNWSASFDPGYSIDASREWHHVVMTIPKFDAEGKKTAKTYVDGAEKKSIELKIPANLENLEVYTPAFRIGGDQNSNYVPDDMSIAGFKIYQGAFPKDAVKELYDLEKGTFADENGNETVAINKVSFKKGNEILYRLDSPDTLLSDGDTIKIGIKENITPDFRIIVCTYNEDENGKLKLVDFVFKNSSEIEDNAINYEYKEGTTRIKVLSWFADSQTPIQKPVAVEKHG